MQPAVFTAGLLALSFSAAAERVELCRQCTPEQALSKAAALYSPEPDCAERGDHPTAAVVQRCTSTPQKVIVYSVSDQVFYPITVSHQAQGADRQTLLASQNVRLEGSVSDEVKQLAVAAARIDEELLQSERQSLPEILTGMAANLAEIQSRHQQITTSAASCENSADVLALRQALQPVATQQIEAAIGRAVAAQRHEAGHSTISAPAADPSADTVEFNLSQPPAAVKLRFNALSEIRQLNFSYQGDRVDVYAGLPNRTPGYPRVAYRVTPMPKGTFKVELDLTRTEIEGYALETVMSANNQGVTLSKCVFDELLKSAPVVAKNYIATENTGGNKAVGIGLR